LPYLDRDGVNLHYEEAGAGDPSLLFVHGWTCNLTHWRAQVEHFSARHRVVAVDLRGHGKSDAPEQEYTMEGYADDIAWLCRELSIERTVVIGHSMGGIVTLVAAARYPELVQAAVLVDAAFPPRMGAAQRLAPVIEALSGPDYLEFAANFIENMFSPADDPLRKAEIKAGMLATPQHVMLSSMRGNAQIDSAAVASAIRQPVLVISAGHIGFSDPSVMSTQYPHMRFAQTTGSGHFNMVEVPAQVNAMLERFLGIEVPKT
jgi:pimeloyl-ACP methyl ester carboxylesterase